MLDIANLILHFRLLAIFYEYSYHFLKYFIYIFEILHFAENNMKIKKKLKVDIYLFVKQLKKIKIVKQIN